MPPEPRPGDGNACWGRKKQGKLIHRKHIHHKLVDGCRRLILEHENRIISEHTDKQKHPPKKTFGLALAASKERRHTCPALHTQTLLHTDTFCTRTLVHRDALTREALTHRRFYKHTLSHTDVFTHIRFYTQTLLHTDVFTHRCFYTHPLTHRCFYTQPLNTQMLLHTRAFTHRRFWTRTLLHTHTDAFTHRRFCTQTLLHTQMPLHTDSFTNFYTQNLLQTYTVKM